MSMHQTIEEKLRAAFDPVFLRVVNESHRHRGHAGDDGSGESHFSVEIVSARFDGAGRLKRQRMVYDVLREELTEIHALSVQASLPEGPK